MIFLLDIAVASLLIAFGFGIALVVWANRNQGVGIGLTKVGGYIIMLSAILGLLCSLYYGFKYWGEDLYKVPGMPVPQVLMHNK